MKRHSPRWYARRLTIRAFEYGGFFVFAYAAVVLLREYAL